MNDKPLGTVKEQEAAMPHFESLLRHTGWKLLVEIYNWNIKFVEEQILSGTFVDSEGRVGEYTKEEMDRKRDKLVVYKECRDAPKKMVEEFTPTEGEEEDFDPYPTVKELKKGRNA